MIFTIASRTMLREAREEIMFLENQRSRNNNAFVGAVFFVFNPYFEPAFTRSNAYLSSSANSVLAAPTLLFPIQYAVFDATMFSAAARTSVA